MADKAVPSAYQDEDLATFHRYFLWRLGLIGDELDWPPPPPTLSSSIAAAASVAAANADGDDGCRGDGHNNDNNNDDESNGNNNNNNNNNISAQWRARDELTTLLGTSNSIIQSDSGLTNVEMALLSVEGENNENGVDSSNNVSIGDILKGYLPDGGVAKSGGGGGGNSDGGGGNKSGGGGKSVISSSSVGGASSSVAPTAIATAAADAAAAAVDAAAGDGDSNQSKHQQTKLDSILVRRAFDAAAFAIARGQRRAAFSTSASPPKQTMVSSSLSNPTPLTTTATPILPTNENETISNSNCYDPPLLLATEAIRRARIASLTAASGPGPGGSSSSSSGGKGDGRDAAKGTSSSAKGDEKDGEWGSCKAVPSFLKKNNTIPWFHIPQVVPPPSQPGMTPQQQKLLSPSGESKPTVVKSSAEKIGSVGVGGGGVGGKKSSASSAKKKEKSTTSNVKKRSNPSTDGKKEGTSSKRMKLEQKKGSSDAKEEKKGAIKADAIRSSITGDGSDKKKKDKKATAANAPTSGKKSKAGSTSDKADKSDKSKTPTSGGKKRTSTATPSTKPQKHTLTSTSTTSPGVTTPKQKAIKKSPPKKKPPTALLAEDPSASGLAIENATISRAILSAATSSVFRDLHPDNSSTNVERNDSIAATYAAAAAVKREENTKIAAIATQSTTSSKKDKKSTTTAADSSKKIKSHSCTVSSTMISPADKKSKADKVDKAKGGDNKAVVDMENITARATRLGHRALDSSRGAARRGDQRREFRRDDALSRLGLLNYDSCVSGNGGSNVKKEGMPLSQMSDKAQFGPANVTNPFVVSPAHALPLVVPNPFVQTNPPLSDGVTDVEMSLSENEDVDMTMMDDILRPQKKSLGDASKTNKDVADAEWTQSCLPRLLTVLDKGAGHAVLHDAKWTNRHVRIANLLRHMAQTPTSSGDGQHGPHSPNYGPHLIVTSSGKDFDNFAAVFDELGCGVREGVVRRKEHSATTATPSGGAGAPLLRVLPYHGSKDDRRTLRKHFAALFPPPESHASALSGHAHSPFHILLTTYTTLMEDFAHFCHMPFQCCILDDGMSWLGAANSDPHGKFGKMWNNGGLWNNFDGGAGEAGALMMSCDPTNWDFGKDVVGFDDGEDEEDEDTIKPKSVSSSSNAGTSSSSPLERNRLSKPPIGITARHRILVASSMHAKFRNQIYKAPVLGLLSFLVPQFAELIRDDWERCRIFGCKRSMAYIRSMIARMVVVYAGDGAVRDAKDLVALALKMLNGELTPSQSALSSLHSAVGPEDVGLDALIKSQKILATRKFAVAWFRPGSPIRREAVTMTFDLILAAVKRNNATGFICEEISTASTLTTAGAGGSVVGMCAYRAAVRCGRCFSSEQGLKQHIATSHAPPGTWLCRSCGGDCGTSQARTHHERGCKAPPKKKALTLGSQSSGGSAAGTVAIADPGSPLLEEVRKRGPKPGPKPGHKKKNSAMIWEKQSREKKIEDEDENDAIVKSSTKVEGCKGVWELTNGKYFVKVGGRPLLVHSDSEKGGKQTEPILFETMEEAAKKFKEITIKNLGEKDAKKESDMNYSSDEDNEIDGADKNDDESSRKGSSAAAAADDSGSIASSAAGDGSGIIMNTPDLSIIDIKKLPPNVKPLLRDPNFTSRTGGNSKRYVYAYRGVCRQQRKGHDRWQSQISYNGQNHYLGTFDSEWDAAAVYAWAHLILYGEEATRRAQLEGEEAAAAFAQHEKDVAEGKVPPPSPTPKKKKKRGAPRKIRVDAGDDNEKTAGKKMKEDRKAGEMKPDNAKDDTATASTMTGSSFHSKKKLPASLKEWSKLKTECAMMLSSGTKGTSKATILATRKDVADMSERMLLRNISGSISGQISCVSRTFLQPRHHLATGKESANSSMGSVGKAILIGLHASNFGWEMKTFIDACQQQHAIGAAQNSVALSLKLSNEFGMAGVNKSFCTVLLTPSCTLGRASSSECHNKFLSSDHMNSMLGMPVGNVDCNIGGPEYSCSKLAARIQFLPSRRHGNNFQLLACNDDDIVTLNGCRLTASMGPRPLLDGDVCSVGARVFAFIESIDSKC